MGVTDAISALKITIQIGVLNFTAAAGMFSLKFLKKKARIAISEHYFDWYFGSF